MRLFVVILSVFILFFSGCGKKEIRKTVPGEQNTSTLIEQADQYYASGDYESAFNTYEYIYNNFPTSREYIDAAIGLSKCYGKRDNYEKKFDILYELLRQNLIPSKVPEVYNEIAGFYEQSAGISEQLTGEGTNDYRTAIEYYEKALNYPNSEDLNAKGKAQYKIGSLYDRLDDFEKAIEAYQNVVNNYSTTPWALNAQENIGKIREKQRLRAEYQQSGLLPDTTAIDRLENESGIDSPLTPPSELPASNSSSTPQPPLQATPDSSREQ